METNESIIAREVVAISDHKKIGKVKGVTVDCDTRAVNDLIVENSSTRSTFALPFEKTISIGDSFVIIDSHDDLLSPNDAAAKLAILDGYTPAGTDVFSQTGNRLGKIRTFEFDEVFGTVSRIIMEDGIEFTADAILFFTPEYVFVDNGQVTPKKLREQKHAAQIQARRETERMEMSELAAKTAEKPLAADTSSDSAELRQALEGATLREDVTSEDGRFKAKSGEKIDKRMLDQAEEHDALVLLTMAIDF